MKEERRSRYDGMTHKTKVLFICTHNSARSQMAEGYLSARYGDRYEAFSAGTEPTRVHPMAVEVMREIGIDISAHRPKLLDVFQGAGMDIVITVCDSDRGICPFFPGAKEEIHRSFPDPAGLAGSDEEIRAGFRRVRDEITRWIDEYFGKNHPADEFSS